MNEDIDPAVLSFALAQLRAEGDEDSARHLLESAGLSAGDDSEQGTQDATLQAALAALGMGEDAPVQKGQWDESKHPRDHGKFSSSLSGGKRTPPEPQRRIQSAQGRRRPE